MAEDEKPIGEGKLASQASAWTEAIRIMPSLLWMALAIGAFAVLYPPVLKLIEQGQIKEVQLGVLHVTMVEHAELAASKVDRDAIGGLAPLEAFKPVFSRYGTVAPRIVGTNLFMGR